jgi:hypothetical protein
MEEINAPRMFEGKNVSKIHGPLTEGECWRIRTNKEIKGILHGVDCEKFIKSIQS